MKRENTRIFAISDLHLPGGEDKSMDLFGPHWQGHFDKIREDWIRRVEETDVVLIPGDISWAMRLEDALLDLRLLGALPGHKVLIKGNHDYWWNALGKVRAALPPGMHAIQNDAVSLGGFVFCGSRGWNMPEVEDEQGDNLKIYRRELARLELSLSAARRLSDSASLIALCHFPPCGSRGEDSPVTELLERYGVSDAVYGHLHGPACAFGFSGLKNGVRYWFASCDCVGFSLVELTVASVPSVGADPAAETKTQRGENRSGPISS